MPAPGPRPRSTSFCVHERASIDPVALAQALIRCPSVTPADAGALGRGRGGAAGARLRLPPADLRRRRQPAGREPLRPARRGRPHLAFAGHTDVVPPGDPAAWRVDPFAGEVLDGVLYGRGAVDMKGAIAAFVAATARFLAEHRPAGSISLLITGDEEGPALNGTRKLLGWLKEQGTTLDACVVGEPTNPARLGEMIKIGRRGSLTGWLTRAGRAGPCRLSRARRQPDPAPARDARRADRRAARRRQRLLPALGAGDHLGRRRQPGHQRDPGRGARDLQHPLQRPPQRERARGAAAQAARCRRRPLRAAHRGPAARPS